MKYIIEYYLPNQSHLFSAPQRAYLPGEDACMEAVETAKKCGYDVIAVYEVISEGGGFLSPVY